MSPLDGTSVPAPCSPLPGAAGIRPARPASLTAGAVLFGNAGPGQAAGASPGWRTAVGRLRGSLGTTISAAGLTVVEQQLSAQLSALLGLNIGDILIDAWRSRRELDAAAKTTQHDPQASTVVPLASHRVLSSHQPSVDLVINDTRVAVLAFDIGIMVDVESVSAVVRHAHLIAIHSGHCFVRVGLSFGGHDIAVCTIDLDPSLAINMRRPVPLLRQR